MNKLTLVVILAGVFFGGTSCRKDQKAAAAETMDTPIEASKPTFFMAEGLSQVWQTDTLLQVPESVVYDPVRKQLYVSNIVGSPVEKDGEGFLSVVSMKGEITQFRWVEGFNAPKGLFIQDDLLYVADIDEVAIISILEGKILRKISMPGAQFLNAITYLPSSNVILITDTNTNSIYWLDADGKIGVWTENEALANPNGIFYTEDKSLLIASFSNDQLLNLDPIGLNVTEIGKGIGAGDGVLVTAAKDTIVSDWGGKVFRLAEGQPQLLIDLTSIQENAADIEWIEKEQLLVVPTFFGNSLRAFRLK